MARSGACPVRSTPDQRHADGHLRQVHGRAVRARVWHDGRQQPAADSALQPGRQRGHANQAAGRQHEFTTIPGVLEDVTDIVLNVKSLVVKNHSDSTRVIRIEKSTTRPDHRRRRPDRRGGRGHQQGSRAGHADRRRAVRDGDGRGERPGLCAGQRAQPRRPRRSASSRSMPCSARSRGSATRSRKPASARRPTTTS